MAKSSRLIVWNSQFGLAIPSSALVEINKVAFHLLLTTHMKSSKGFHLTPHSLRFFAFIIVAGLGPMEARSAVIDVTAATSLTIQTGDVLDVYFHASDFMDDFPVEYQPSLPVAFTMYGLTSFAVGQALSGFTFNAWMQSSNQAFSIPFPTNPILPSASTVNSGATYDINAFFGGWVPVSGPSQVGLFGNDGSQEARLHVEYTGAQPFTFEMVNVPPFNGIQMGDGPGGGMLTVGLRVDLTINGNPGSSSAIGLADRVELTQAPEPGAASLLIVGSLFLLHRKKRSEARTYLARY